MAKYVPGLSLCFCLMFQFALAQQQSDLPCDKNATQQTTNLYHNLKSVLNEGIMFGHQDDGAYGVGWKYEPGRSDVKDVTGDYPAVVGYELGGLELDHAVNLDSVPFDKMRGFIQDAYNQGSVITISWHLNNPLTGKTAWDPAPGTVASVLPGGEKNALYSAWLDKLTVFFNSLKGSKGEFIPVVFRPFHELNGSWFWWGGKNCTPAEVKQLYQYTQQYLRNVKGLHHLLYAFNTDKFYSVDEFFERYPGDEFVDVIGFDIYERNGNEAFMKDANNMLGMLENIALEHNKIPALTEFGYGNLPDATWFTSILLPVLKSHKISWALAWRNAGFKQDGSTEFYLPYKGHAAADDFAKFCADKKIWLQKDAAKARLYHKK